MGHQYGMSRRGRVQRGRRVRSGAAGGDGRDRARSARTPSTGWDRATALAALERYDEAVADFERAKRSTPRRAVLDDDMLDDAYFSALLGAARAVAANGDVAGGCAKLERYAGRFPSGRHVSDAGDWQKRLRGELKSTFVKERLE